MSLFKKIVFGIFIIAALVLGAWAYINLKNNKKPKVDALTLLPDNCLVYLSSSNFFDFNKKLNSQSLIADRLKLFNDINIFCSTLSHFDSLFNNRPLLRDELNKNPIHFALYGDDLKWLVTFNVRQLGQQNTVNEEISKTLHATLIENNIYSFNSGRNSKFYYTIDEGVVIISNSQESIALAMNSAGQKLYKNPLFVHFKNTLEENGLLSMYVNHNLYEKSPAALKLNLPAICKNGASAGSLDIKPSELKINGFLQPDSSSIISAFKDEPSQEIDFIESLPFTTNFFQTYGFGSFTKLKAKLPALQDATNKQFWSDVNDSALYNLDKNFSANIDHHIVDFESGSLKQKFVALKISDTLLALEHLRLMSDSAIKSDVGNIFKLKGSQLNTSLKLFNGLSACNTRYAMIFHEYIYFGEGSDDLKQLLYNFNNNMLMTENESFVSYKNQNFPESFNYLVYTSPRLNSANRTTFFNFTTDSKKDPFENFKHFCFSVTSKRGGMEFRWNLVNETERVNKEPNILWALQLDTTSSMQARLFVNHITKENELLVQDEAKKLYLVNAKGTILWKKELDETINSAIFIVDLFKNNRFQMLFSTRNQLHLIDRNGNYLPGYPVKLPAEASSPLSVFDYDNTRDYRLFIACNNKKIYNFSISGQRQEGFTPFKTNNLTRLPIQYIKVGLSDYLVALDEDGEIYTFSRRGEARIGLKNKATANCKAFYLDATSNINSTYFVYADDKSSLINKISFSDKKNIIKLNHDVENAGVKFLPTRNGKHVNLIFTKLNAVLIYDINGNLLLRKSFENDLTETDIYEDEMGSSYFTRSEIRQELLAFDPRREQIKLFKASAMPLVTDLFNDHKKFIIVTNGNRLSCILLN